MLALGHARSRAEAEGDTARAKALSKATALMSRKVWYQQYKHTLQRKQAEYKQEPEHKEKKHKEKKRRHSSD